MVHIYTARKKKVPQCILFYSGVGKSSITSSLSMALAGLSAKVMHVHVVEKVVLK